MNNRTEAKLTDLSGMQKAIEEILKQAWERGRKHGQNEAKPIAVCKVDINKEEMEQMVEKAKCNILAEIKDSYGCETCEAKANSYSMGFKDGYHTGGFDFVLLRRWLVSQGYSEGTADEKIESFQRFIKRIREEE